MKLRSWTIIYAQGGSPGGGINYVHALNLIHEPRSYIINDRPCFICHYFADSFLKTSENIQKSHHFYCSPISCSTKYTPKSMTLLECTIQNRGVRCACAYAWAHNNKYLCCILSFWRQHFLKHHFIFAIKYTELKIIHFERVRVSFIKKHSTYFWKCDQILIISQS